MSWFSQLFPSINSGAAVTTAQVQVGSSLGPQNTGLLGNALGGGGNQPGGAGGPSVTFGTVPNIGGVVGPTLTPEESNELSVLSAEHAGNIKAAKVNEFKKLPPEMRQYVINAFAWAEAVSNINKVSVEKTPRQIELEGKNNSIFGNFQWNSHANQLYISNGTISQPINWNILPNTYMSLPDGLSIEDLNNAHMEATLEEEMCNVSND